MIITQETVIGLIAEVFNLSPNQVRGKNESADFAGWDSLTHLVIMMRIEEKLGVNIEMEKIADLDSIEKITQYLNAQ